MLTLAFRNLFQEKIKLFISIMGVAFSVLLIMVLMGVYQGLNTKLGEYIQTVPADLWVAQEGSKNLFDSTSVLSATAKAQIEQVEGVNSVKVFNGRQITVNVNGVEKRAFVVGLGGNSGAVSPKIVEGTADIKSGEIILDRSLKDAKLGQEVTVGGQTFKVAGITEGGNVLIVTYAFMHSDDATKLFKQDGVVNYFIVNAADDADIARVVKGIETAVPDTRAMGTAAFINNTTSVVKEVFLPIIAVLSLIGMAVGITVIGLTIFTSTLEKAKEYGVLKAIGIRDSQLYKIVLQQSLITSVIGFMVGAALGLGLTELAMKFVPEFVSSIQTKDVVLLFIATIVMGAIAAFLPARRITKIDPAEVFKG
mgnify:CR=1 FL=1